MDLLLIVIGVYTKQLPVKYKPFALKISKLVMTDGVMPSSAMVF